MCGEDLLCDEKSLMQSHLMTMILAMLAMMMVKVMPLIVIRHLYVKEYDG